MRRRSVRRALRVIAKLQAREKLSEAQIERHNRLTKYVNRIRSTLDGFPIMEGSAECPECGKEIVLMADVCGWERRECPKWRRKRRNRKPALRVTDYWGGIGDCCTGFIAAQPDGECHFYPHLETA